MRLIITVIFVTSCLYAGAQVPGYLGKRFTLFLDANPTPALLVRNTNNALVYSNDRTRKNAFAFNFRPQLSFDYLVQRDISIGLSAAELMVGTEFGMDSQSENGTIVLSNPAVLKGQSMGFHVKFFSFRKSASIAPIGFFTSLSFNVTRSNAYTDLSSKAKLLPKDVMVPATSYSIGRQSIIAKNLLLKTGVEFGIALVSPKFWSEADSQWTAEELTKYRLHRSLFGYHNFSIHVGLGYIAF